MWIGRSRMIHLNYTESIQKIRSNKNNNLSSISIRTDDFPFHCLRTIQLTTIQNRSLMKQIKSKAYSAKVDYFLDIYKRFNESLVYCSLKSYWIVRELHSQAVISDSNTSAEKNVNFVQSIAKDSLNHSRLIHLSHWIVQK